MSLKDIFPELLFSFSDHSPCAICSFALLHHLAPSGLLVTASRLFVCCFYLSAFSLAFNFSFSLSSSCSDNTSTQRKSLPVPSQEMVSFSLFFFSVRTQKSPPHSVAKIEKTTSMPIFFFPYIQKLAAFKMQHFMIILFELRKHQKGSFLF